MKTSPPQPLQVLPRIPHGIATLGPRQLSMRSPIPAVRTMKTHVVRPTTPGHGIGSSGFSNLNDWATETLPDPDDPDYQESNMKKQWVPQ